MNIAEVDAVFLRAAEGPGAGTPLADVLATRTSTQRREQGRGMVVGGHRASAANSAHIDFGHFVVAVFFIADTMFGQECVADLSWRCAWFRWWLTCWGV